MFNYPLLKQTTIHTHFTKYLIFMFCGCFLIGCQPGNTSSEETKTIIDMSTICPHTYALKSATINHLDLDIEVDFENKQIRGRATYSINPTTNDEIIFDSYKLNIISIVLNGTDRLEDYRLGEMDGIMGQPLFVRLKQDTRSVTIEYQTSTDALALQWLDPPQTAGKEKAFLYTQGQAILTRSWIPIQDSPGLRLTYNARVKVPRDMMAVMSASNSKNKSAEGVYNFRMEQPIPPYLISLAVGNLAYHEISDRTGVYAEPASLDSASWEFADIEKMVHTAEELYGPYLWDQFDVLVLPPSFPFGGMENPRLTFSTPTIITGDRSLTSLIAHELAHSWSGNLVTNATWNDFWLNEGFTVYFERRIMEKLYGKEIADMHTYIGYQDLLTDLELLGIDSKETRLKLDLKGKDPDSAVNAIAYEKGFFFVKELEKLVGRERFDRFLTDYFSHFKFKTIDTEQFLEYLYSNLLDPLNIAFNAHLWVYQPGLPEGFEAPACLAFERVKENIPAILRADSKSILDTKEWDTNQWIYFIRELSAGITNEEMRVIDQAFGFTNSGNAEIKFAWYQTAIESGYYTEIRDYIKNFLVSVGRRKFLTPLYQALVDREDLEFAKEIYNKARPNYHAVSRSTIDEILGVNN